MATDINVVVLVGRLTRDCEMKSTAQGTSVCRFSVAVNRRKRTGDKWEDEVSYIDVVLWGKSAETLSSYLTKGRQVSIQGELRQNRWEQNGQKYSKIEVIANSVQLLASSQGGAAPQDNGGYNNNSYNNNYQQSQPRANSAPQQQAQAPVMGGPESFDDSDIPF
jgi:single-strand DNA-binding protein